MIGLARRARGPEPESGIAMVLVIAMSALLAIFLVAAVSFALGTVKSSRKTQDWDAAIAAAYAGIEEYQSRLADDTSYFRYGNPASPFSAGSVVTLPTGPSTNPAFGLGTSGTWATVAGSGGAAQFRYEVDSSQYYSNGGKLRLRSTGLAGGETRTIVADLKAQGFIDFIYFTDYEIQDPQMSGASVADCVKYAWNGRPTTGCSEIAFGSGDTVNGPAHSNDKLRICDATFTQVVTTGWNPNPAPALLYVQKDSNNNSCSGQVFNAGPPAARAVMPMPATNSQLKKETQSGLADVPRPGCLYTGPTKITFNSNGTMTVRSPWTKKTNVVGDTPTSGSTPPECGTPGTGAGHLGDAAGQTLAVPDNNVIYVQNVPTNTADPNYSSAPPAGLTTSTGANGANGLGFPMANEVTPQGATSALPAYGFKNGDAFVSGTLKGHLTVAAENYIYATGDIKYLDSSDDMLGLVGQNAVWVWNPVNSWGGSLLGGSGREIDAAILSVTHTFQVQNYSTGGSRGVLTIHGSIAQKFRGIVRSGSNGYTKQYNYDDRFRTTAPPKYLSPTTTTYGVSVWVEVSPAFAPNGATN